MVLATRRIKGLDRADKLKQRGLYVDPHGGSTPSAIGKNDLEKRQDLGKLRRD
jgi:hypothetical protein